MLEDHKSLNYYILKAGMKIVVERKSWSSLIIIYHIPPPL